MEIGQIQIKDLPHKSTLNPADRLPVQNVSGGIGSTGSIPLEWLLSRSNHTGTITINDIQNLQAILDSLLQEIHDADPLPDVTDNANKFLTNDGATVSWADIPREIPSYSSHDGKFLSNNGSELLWIRAPDPLPLQAGHDGKVLSTDGTNVYWTNIENPLPNHAGNFGKYLYTDGQTIYWASVVDISGPTDLVIYQTGTYTISNYDSFTDYSVTCSTGSVSRSGNTISYTAPSTPGIGGFTVNGNKFNITIGNVTINTPSITSPTNASQNNALKPTLTGTPLTLSSGTGTHVASHWQIARNNGFSDLVVDTGEDFTNKQSYKVDSFLANNFTYYARVRYKDVKLGWSDWSPTISFVTVNLLNTYARYNVGSITFVEYLSDGYIYICTDDNRLSRVDRNTLQPILTKQFTFPNGSSDNPYKIQIGSIVKHGSYYYVGLYSVSPYAGLESSKIIGIARLNSNLDIVISKVYLVPANDPYTFIPEKAFDLAFPSRDKLGTGVFNRGQLVVFNNENIGILVTLATPSNFQTSMFLVDIEGNDLPLRMTPENLVYSSLTYTWVTAPPEPIVALRYHTRN